MPDKSKSPAKKPRIMMSARGVLAKDINLANVLIHRGKEEKYPLTNLHLQKIMYFTYGYCLARHNLRAGDTKFEPWEMGPVVSNVYFMMRPFGAHPITEYCMEFEPEDSYIKAFPIAKTETEFWDTLDEVWRKYRPMSANALIKASHHPDGAWHKAHKSKLMHLRESDILQEFKGVV